MEVGMAIGDPIDVAKRRKLQSGYTLPAVNNFFQGNPSGAMTNLGPQFKPANIPSPNYYKPGSIGDNIGSGFGQSFTNPYASLFNGASTSQQPPTSRMPFVSGGYQYPAGSALPPGFQEDNAGGLTRRVNAPTAPRYSAQPFVEGGYTFPAGSQLPEGFQESGGGGLTRQIPQDTGEQSTVHFLPPGFTSTTGSTGVPGSTQNDTHFLPPGFSSVAGITDTNSKQLRQPWLGGY